MTIMVMIFTTFTINEYLSPPPHYTVIQYQHHQATQQNRITNTTLYRHTTPSTFSSPHVPQQHTTNNQHQSHSTTSHHTTHLFAGAEDQYEEPDLLAGPAHVGGLLEARDGHVAAL